MTAHVCSKEKEWSPAREIGMGVLSTVLWLGLGYVGGSLAFESDNFIIVSSYILAVITMIGPGLVNGVGAVFNGAGRLVRQ